MVLPPTEPSAPAAGHLPEHPPTRDPVPTESVCAGVGAARDVPVWEMTEHVHEGDLTCSHLQYNHAAWCKRKGWASCDTRATGLSVSMV